MSATRINTKRLLIGALAGTVVWSIWTSLITMNVLLPVYGIEEKAGLIFGSPRYGFGAFFASWLLILFAVSTCGALLYALLSEKWGRGLTTALKIGGLLGFVAAVPSNFSMLNWSTVTSMIPLFWMIDMWVGVILTTCISAVIYKDE